MKNKNPVSHIALIQCGYTTALHIALTWCKWLHIAKCQLGIDRCTFHLSLKQKMTLEEWQVGESSRTFHIRFELEWDFCLEALSNICV